MPKKEAKPAAKRTKPTAKASKPAARAARPVAKATKPAAGRERSQSTHSPTSEDIAVRAYCIFEAEGGGDHVEHWLRAERELTTV